MNQEPNNPDKRLTANLSSGEELPILSELSAHRIPYKFSLIKKVPNTGLMNPNEITINCWPYGVIQDTDQTYNLRDAFYSPFSQNLLIVVLFFLVPLIFLRYKLFHECPMIIEIALVILTITLSIVALRGLT